MSNLIKLKKSSVGDKVPLPGDLEYGELALNYTDGNLFYKNSSNAVTTIASNKFVDVSGNITAGGDISATGNVTGNYIIGNGSQLTSLATFSIIVTAGQSNVVANTSGVLNFATGGGISIVTDAATGTVTFTNTSAASIFGSGGSMGTVTEAVTSSEDLGFIDEIYTTAYNLETVVDGGLVWPEQFRLPPYTVAGLPSASIAGCMVFVTDASGGSIPAFADGTNWRRVDDRTIVT